MSQQISAATLHIEIVLTVLQAFQVLFLWLHDWVPLGRLNDVKAVRSQDSVFRLAVVTLIQSVPFTIGLLFSLAYFCRLYPRWLDLWLWISYSEFFSDKFALGGYPIFSGQNRNVPLVIRSCLAIPTASCRPVMGLSRTRRTSCFTWQPLQRCSHSSRSENQRLIGNSETILLVVWP